MPLLRSAVERQREHRPAGDVEESDVVGEVAPELTHPGRDVEVLPQPEHVDERAQHGPMVRPLPAGGLGPMVPGLTASVPRGGRA